MATQHADYFKMITKHGRQERVEAQIKQQEWIVGDGPLVTGLLRTEKASELEKNSPRPEWSKDDDIALTQIADLLCNP